MGTVVGLGIGAELTTHAGSFICPKSFGLAGMTPVALPFAAR